MQKPKVDEAQGVLTLAFGAPMYFDYACSLALSLERHSPEYPRALITDRDPSPLLRRLFTHIVRLPEKAARGLITHLYLYDLSPFDSTLYVDSDSLAIRSIAPIWAVFDGQDFGVLGQMASLKNAAPQNGWFHDTLHTCQVMEISEWASFNGGLYFFRKTPIAKQVFDNAYQLMERYDELKLRRWGSGMSQKNDEPLMSLAMTKLGHRPKANESHLMLTTAGIRGALKVNVERSDINYVRWGRTVSPCLCHFSMRSGYYGYTYTRERKRLQMSDRASTPVRRLAAFLGFCKNESLTAITYHWVCLRPLLAAAKRRVLRRFSRPSSIAAQQ